jgi:hypothetical protein
LKQGFLKLCVPVLNVAKQKRIFKLSGMLCFPLGLTFHSVTEAKLEEGEGESSKLPCYLGFCKKISLGDIFFVLTFFDLIFSGPECVGWGSSFFFSFH